MVYPCIALHVIVRLGYYFGVVSGALKAPLHSPLKGLKTYTLGDDSVDDSEEDPNYVVSDNELNQSESDDSFAVDEPQLEDEEMTSTIESEDDFFWGKDGSVWYRKEPPKQRRTPQHNILRGPLPGPTARGRALGNNPLITRFEFIKRLTLKLVKPHMTRRLEIQNLPRDVRRVITEYVGETEAANQ
ncbi:hypothetical protein J6590_032677 [Homalodisca vitripennis]|nr:hypothetical protein J6590_032677 [Homalodisca vitripennis]